MEKRTQPTLEWSVCSDGWHAYASADVHLHVSDTLVRVYVWNTCVSIAGRSRHCRQDLVDAMVFAESKARGCGLEMFGKLMEVDQ